MATTQELIFKITRAGDGATIKSDLAQIRSELSQTAKTQKITAQGELSTRQQLAAAASLQRQRSAALISQWKQQERAAVQLAAGVKPVATNLQRITDVMQTLGASSATLQGPLGGVASRLRSVGSLATEAGGGIGVMGAAAGALVVGLAAAAVAIYKITVAAAEFQGRMFDLSQQTGVSVETLSTLDAVARTTGGDIDAISQSLGVFQSHLENAQDPTSKEAILLKELGVESNNTEEALRQTLAALARMPEGFEQTAAARDLFGGRGAKAFLAILKETNGDLDGTTERLRAMGILITTEAATAADIFNDRLSDLGLQIRGLAAIIGNEAMPTITEAVKAASQVITDNRGIVVGWAGDIADAARGVVILADFLRELNNTVSGMKAVLPEWVYFMARFAQEFSGLPGIMRELQKLGNQGIPALAVPDLAVPLRQSGPGTVIKPRKGGRSGSGAADRAAKQALADQLEDINLIAEAEQQRIDESITENKRALGEQVRDIEEFTRRAIELADERLNAIIDRTNSEGEALQAALNKKLITQREFDLKWKQQSIEVEDARQANSDETFDLERERDKKISQAELAARDRQFKLAEDADGRVIQRIQDRLDRELLAESEGQRRIGEVIQNAFQRRKEALEAEETAYATTLERRKAITDELVKLEGDRAFAAEQAAARIAKARFEEENRDAEGATRRRRATQPEDVSSIDQLGSAIERNLSGEMLSGATAALDTMIESFGGLADAVSSALDAFIKFGSAGTSFRKVVAEILSGVARMAATKAIFELAEGFAALALAYFGIPNAGPSAQAHFTAAAIYGSVAAVAAVAGRAAAGNSFQQSSTPSGGGSGSSGKSAGSSTPATKEVDRKQGGQNMVIQFNPTIVVKGEATEGFRYMVEKVAVQSVRGNGTFRKIQNGEDV